jgi:hypothetical protein
MRTAYLITLAIFVASLLPANAQESATVSFSTSRVYQVAATGLWAVVGDFCIIKRFEGYGMRVEIDGSGIGMTRSLVYTNGFRIVERLVALDNPGMTLTYSVVDNPALSYTNYCGILSVKPDTADRSILSWAVTFDPQAGKGQASLKGILMFAEAFFNNIAKICSPKP